MRKFFLMAVWFLGSVCHAETYRLLLNSLERIHQSEVSGDELYIAVAEYGPDGKDNLIETPDFPLHWFSDALQSIQDEPIWEGTLESGQSLTLQVELDERDTGIFGSDENIGLARVVLKHTEAGLSEFWESRDGDGVPQESMSRGGVHEYLWKAGKAEYRIRLSVEEKT